MARENVAPVALPFAVRAAEVACSGEPRVATAPSLALLTQLAGVLNAAPRAAVLVARPRWSGRCFSCFGWRWERQRRYGCKQGQVDTT